MDKSRAGRGSPVRLASLEEEDLRVDARTTELLQLDLEVANCPDQRARIQRAFLLGLRHASSLFGATGHARFDIAREVARLTAAMGQSDSQGDEAA